MIPPSERAIRALEALGGEAPLEHVRGFIDWAHGPNAVDLALDLAVLRGAVARIELGDGRAGLRLTGAAQKARP